MFAVRQISVCEQRNAAVVEMVLEEGRSLLSQNAFVRAGVVFSAGRAVKMGVGWGLVGGPKTRREVSLSCLGYSFYNSLQKQVHA